MSSQVLLQRPSEEVPPAAPKAAIQVTSTRIDSIVLRRGGPETRASKVRPFDFDVDLSERGRTGGDVRVGYYFSFGRQSSGQVCKITGEAVVRFSQFNMDRLNDLDNDITNEIAIEIFRKNYESAYLLHDAMAMDAPSPWVTQEVSLSSRIQGFRDSGEK